MKSDLVIAVLWITIMVLVVATRNHAIDAYRNNCTAAGGHIYHPSTIYFCLDDSGRMIEVYP